jgi:hypothetical protein
MGKYIPLGLAAVFVGIIVWAQAWSGGMWQAAGGSLSTISYSGAIGGTNRTATLKYDFANNFWYTEVADD